MLSFTDRLQPEEQPAGKRRITRSQTRKEALARKMQYPSGRFPSPRTTDASSTDNILTSSSSTPPNPKPKPKPKPKPVHSLRDRLLAPPKKASARSSIDHARAGAKRPRSKPSVAPFFQRVEAAFQANTTASKTDHTISPAQGRLPRSPSPDPDELIRQLKEHYLRTATSLHAQATARLAQTHASLAGRMAQAAQADAAFLQQTEQRIRDLTQPLGTFRIRSHQRQGPPPAEGGAGGGGADAAGRKSEENDVGELVARAEEQVRAFEEDVGRLWREWAVAEGEVKGLLGKIVAPASGSVSGGVAGAAEEAGGEDDEGAELLRRFGEAVEKEIGEAEEEVVGLGNKAVAMMKEIEKDFRKATLPDLLTFYQSIDEP